MESLQKTPNVHLVTIGNRSLSTRGWRMSLAQEHLEWHLGQPQSKKWCEVGCMAKVFFGRNTETNRIQIRRRIAPTFKHLLARDLFLVVEYDRSRSGHGKIIATKLFEHSDSIERNAAEEQLDRLKTKLRITDEMREKAHKIICRTNHNAQITP